MCKRATYNIINRGFAFFKVKKIWMEKPEAEALKEGKKEALKEGKKEALKEGKKIITIKA